MPDKEKIIKGLKTCMSEDFCTGCPYYENGTDCTGALMEDTFALLEEQQKLIDSITKRRMDNGAFD